VQVTGPHWNLVIPRRCAPGHLRSVRSRVMDHIDPSALSYFAKAVTAIAEGLE
jgi:hypothetical protein